MHMQYHELDDVTFETLTPGANSISYLVTVGPGTTFVNSASTPCSFNKFVKIFCCFL